MVGGAVDEKVAPGPAQTRVHGAGLMETPALRPRKAAMKLRRDRNDLDGDELARCIHLKRFGESGPVRRRGIVDDENFALHAAALQLPLENRETGVLDIQAATRMIVILGWNHEGQVGPHGVNSSVAAGGRL